MSRSGHVAWLRVSPRSGENVGVSSLTAIAQVGVEGDRHARRDKRNQVLLIERETLDALELRAGDVRENVATRGVPLMELREGDRLAIGADVELVVSHPCAPCGKMDSLRPGLRAELDGRRGMLATVASGGVIVPGDPIEVRAGRPTV